MVTAECAASVRGSAVRKPLPDEAIPATPVAVPALTGMHKFDALLAHRDECLRQSRLADREAESFRQSLQEAEANLDSYLRERGAL